MVAADSLARRSTAVVGGDRSEARADGLQKVFLVACGGLL
ncbi:hypothetical protein DM2_2623 [Halorubrum sp. DM2]|nr:hypothetical protein DM2_2623 [Halorubrum sp. DM2]